MLAVESKRVLLLNSTWEPLRIISWQRAVTLWFENKIEILEEYEDFALKSVSVTIKCPAVVRLLQYVNGRKHRVKFSRVNVFARDNYRCSYCNVEPGTPSLTYDHVIPRSRGGKTTWENIVTACISCNAKKADRTPEEAKMKLKIKPVKPSWSPTIKLSLAIPKAPDCWKDYLRDWLYWNSELNNDND